MKNSYRGKGGGGANTLLQGGGLDGGGVVAAITWTLGIHKTVVDSVSFRAL